MVVRKTPRALRTWRSGGSCEIARRYHFATMATTHPNDGSKPDFATPCRLENRCPFGFPVTENAYQSPLSAESEVSVKSSPRRTPLVVRFFFPLVAPILVAFGLYLPFWFLASKINLATYASNDNFYYRAAILTWPTYAAAGAMFLAFMASRIRLGWLGWLVCFVHGLIAMFNTQYIDDWIGLYGGPRRGLDSWPGNSPNINTAQISVFSIPFVYLIATIAASILAHQFRRSARRPSS